MDVENMIGGGTVGLTDGETIERWNQRRREAVSKVERGRRGRQRQV